MAASKKKTTSSGPGGVLGFLTDELAVLDAGHGNAVPGTNPLTAATHVVNTEVGVPKAAIGAIGGAAGAIGSITSFVTSPSNWLRLLEVIAGVILVAMGLHQLTGAGDGVVKVAKKAATAGRG